MRGLHIFRFHANVKAQSLCRASSQNQTRRAGLQFCILSFFGEDTLFLLRIPVYTYLIPFRKDLGVIYQALYRKYRPRTFDDVWGQENITETLKQQVTTGRTSHAYLFVGTRGTGKTTCAKLLARAVNCEHPVNGSPCNECAACRGIEAGTVMDVVEIDAASNNGVDNIRALRDEAIFSPATVKKRVYIVDEVHMLSASAFNALLKILEEPPEHLMFILATTELRKVPATILSRCQRFNFRRLDADVIAKRLSYVARNEAINLTEGAARLLARLADGGMRDALSLLDQCSGRELIDENVVLETTGAAGSERIARLLETIASHDSGAALGLFAELWSDGKDPAGVLSDLNGLMRDALILSVAPKGGGSLVSGAYSTELLKRFGTLFTREELLHNMTAAQEGMSQLRDSPSARTTAELTLVRLCTPSLDPSALESRLSRVERMLEGGVTIAPAHSVTSAPAASKAAPIPEPLPVLEPTPEPARAEEPTVEPELAESSYDEAPPWSDEDAPPLMDGGMAYPAPGSDTPPRHEEPKADEPIRTPAPKRDSPQPIPEPVPERAPEPESPPSGDGFNWDSFVSLVGPKLSRGYAMLFRSASEASGELNGDVLTVYLSAGILYNGLNNPASIEAMRSAAKQLTGRDINVRLAELGDAMQRNLDELRAFKEVRFIRKDGN